MKAYISKAWAAARDIITYPIRDALDDYKMCRKESTDTFDNVVMTGMIQLAKNMPTLATLAATALLAPPDRVNQCLAVAAGSLVVTNILGAHMGGRDGTPFLPSLKAQSPTQTPA